MPVVKCSTCKKQFNKSPSKIKRSKNHFCSKDCKHVKNEYITVSCDFCEKEFIQPKNKTKRNNHNFCSRKCFTDWRDKKIRTFCDFCNKKIIIPLTKYQASKNHFCSKQCSGKFRYSKISLSCNQCGKTIKRDPSRMKIVKNHYCSKRCLAIWQSENICGENHHQWKGHSEYYGPNWNRQRNAARKRDNYTCQHCKITEKKHGQQLDVHHIIPFRKFGYKPHENDNYKKANSLSNLICLCKKCHIKAEFGSIAIQTNLLHFIVK